MSARSRKQTRTANQGGSEGGGREGSFSGDVMALLVHSLGRSKVPFTLNRYYDGGPVRFIHRVTAESFCGGPRGTIDQSAFPFSGLDATEAKNEGAKRRCELNTKQFSVTQFAA